MKQFNARDYVLEILVTISVLLTLSSWVYPSYIFEAKSNLEVSLLAFDGYASFFDINNKVYIFILIINVVGTLGLVFYLDFFRWFFLLLLIFNYGFLFFLGYRVAPPVDNLIFSAIAFVDGMLLTTVFLRR